MSSIKEESWYELADAAALATPALLVYRQRVEENLRRMLAIAGGPDRLRPHVKTHKMPELIKLQLALGITRFKCATIAEMEMSAEAGAGDVLLAYQPVGPAIKRVQDLLRRFPQVQFSVIADDVEIVRGLSRAIETIRRDSGAKQAAATLSVLVDLDIGQHRTGVAPGDEAVELYRLIASLPGLKPGGLHAYDGHISDADPVRRAVSCEEAFGPVAALRQRLEHQGLEVPRIVAGGTPTFPFHAKRQNVECSPGTCVFWDAGYGKKLADMEFLMAVLVLTRVVSKPGGHRLCLDLGHKAVASEMPHPRAVFLNLPDAQSVVHSEEHLVIESSRSGEFKVGDWVYALPWHICPTVALHSEARVVENRLVTGTWRITAREPRITV